MTRKTSAFGAASDLDSTTEFLVRQAGNKRLPRAALQAFIESLLPPGSGGDVTFATLEQAQAAIATDVAMSPARVREYLEQFGLTAPYTNAATDLNGQVKGGFFSYDSGTQNTPVASSYGRGLTLPAGSGYVTQLAIENATGQLSVRYQDNGTWSAWAAIGADGGSGGGSAAITALRSDDLGVTETALVDALTFEVEANTIYRLSASLLYRTTATSKGLRVGIGGTAGMQSVAIRAATFDSSGAPVAQFAHAKGVPLIFSTSATGGDDNLLDITGQIYTTAAGTLTIQIGAAVQYDYTAAQKGSGGFLEPLGTIAA